MIIFYITYRSGTMDEDMPSASDAILYPNHVAPYMNIFHVLGVGK